MARIIKAERPGLDTRAASSGRRVDARVYDAVRQADEILAGARSEADRLRQAAREEGERLQAGAREAGRQEGLAQAAGLLARASLERERKLAGLEQELVVLAMAVARKVLGRELSLDRSAVVQIAAQALLEARERREITIRVHPEDAAALRLEEGRLLERVQRARWIEVREDEAVPRGGVVVETEAGTIDARIETQLQALARALEEAAGDPN